MQPPARPRTATDSWQLGGYCRLKHRALHVDGLLACGPDAGIAFGDFARHARAEFDENSLRAYLEAGYAFDTTPFLQPCVALQDGGQHRDAHAEQGAGVLNLVVEAQDCESLRAQLGLRVRNVLIRGVRGALVAELRGAWLREFGDSAAFRVRLAGDQTGALFSVDGSQAARNIGNLGAGIVANLGPHAHSLVDFAGELSSAHHAFSFGGGVRLRC
jgi:outer membrane autotransporter protein